MTMTIYFNSHEIQIYRHRRKGSSNRYGFSATYTAYNADIQPSGTERLEMANGRFGQLWDGYIDVDVNIKEGDQIVIISSGDRFSVKGVTKWDGAGLLSHKQLLLTSVDGDNG